MINNHWSWFGWSSLEHTKVTQKFLANYWGLESVRVKGFFIGIKNDSLQGNRTEYLNRASFLYFCISVFWVFLDKTCLLSSFQAEENNLPWCSHISLRKSKRISDFLRTLRDLQWKKLLVIYRGTTLDFFFFSAYQVLINGNSIIKVTSAHWSEINRKVHLHTKSLLHFVASKWHKNNSSNNIRTVTRLEPGLQV